MFLKNLKLQNFRNYDLLNIDFDDGINIIYGKNGQGKTNLLESIYVLGLSKSHKSFIDTKLIKENANFLRIKGKLKKSDKTNNLEINILENNKQLIVDKKEKKKLTEYTSIMNVIFFYPEDLELIKGSPVIRRKYINTELTQLNNEYLKKLNDYNKLLKMKNDYLKNNYKNIKDDVYLDTLNDYYIKISILILKYRKKYISKINNLIENIYYNIAGIHGLKLIFKSNIDLEYENDEDLYSKIKDKIKDNLMNEKKLKTTLIGPNRDDIEFYVDNKNLKLYGSQGQQRMAVLALKLSEIEIFKEVTGEYPILLLDDVFSELDKKKRNSLIKYINRNIQTFITTTDLKSISKTLRSNSKLIEIDNGSITKIEEVKEHE